VSDEIKTIAVIGAGDAGREFACAAVLAGFRTFLEDVSATRLGEAVAWIAKVASGAHSRLVIANSMEQAVREADLIFEAVAEDAEMKIEMFTIFDKLAKPDAILASSSLALPIAELAAMTFCPERCIGMRLVSETGREKLLELVRAPGTSEATMEACRAVGGRLRRKIVVVAERGSRRTSQNPDEPSASEGDSAAMRR